MKNIPYILNMQLGKGQTTELIFLLYGYYSKLLQNKRLQNFRLWETTNFLNEKHSIYFKYAAG